MLAESAPESPRGLTSANKGDIGLGSAAPLEELVLEVLFEKAILRVNADFEADEGDQDAGDQQRPPRVDEAGGNLHEQDGGVDGMAEAGIWPGGDEFVALGDGCLKTPLLAQVPGGAPGKVDTQRSQKHAGGELGQRLGVT